MRTIVKAFIAFPLLVQITLTSCTSNDDFFFEMDNDIYEMARSEEFLHYQLKYKNLLISFKDSASYGVYGNDSNYTVYCKDLTEDALLADKAYEAFINKYPKYSFLSSFEKNEMLNIAASRNSDLAKLIKRRIVTKSGNSNPESMAQQVEEIVNQKKAQNISVYNTIIDSQAYGSLNEAFDRCSGLDFETGGYLFADGTAFWYYLAMEDPQVHWRVFYDPEKIANTGGVSLDGVFHYHPDYSFFSDEDKKGGTAIANYYGVDIYIYLKNKKGMQWGFFCKKN